MLNRDHPPRREGANEPRLAIDAMAFAERVAAEFKRVETGYRNGKYKFIGTALTSYWKFLEDIVGYKELLSRDNITRLREKPDLKKTSRLVLYHLTGAQNEPERHAAGKLARVVDYLHQQGIGGDVAAEHIQSLGGIEEILKKARGVLRAADQARQDEDRELDQEDETDDADDSASRDVTDDLFDPEQDLSIRLGREKLAQVLDSEIGMDESFYLQCRKTGSIGRDGIRIIGQLWGSESE